RTSGPSAMGVLVSDPRDDDQPISIETDAPEADWIEQHQPVVDEPDEDDLFPEEGRGEDRAISIEADAPEADWIEQHQPVVDEPDEDFTEVPQDVAEGEVLEQAERFAGDSMAADDEADDEADGEPDLDPSRAQVAEASPGARGCNLVASLVHALAGSARGGAGRFARRDLRSSR
ncbi:MAG: hypothetical protein QOF40_655, partial [Actinomycetota bacterium]|nr:hypothetical protein [Actinomycetota bacterium]